MTRMLLATIMMVFRIMMTAKIIFFYALICSLGYMIG